MSDSTQPINMQEITALGKKSQHNKKYYELHKPQCYRKSLIYDIRKSGRIPKKEIMQRYGLPLDEFIKLFGTWANNKPLTNEKKEALSQLVVQYFNLKETCQPHDSTKNGDS
jgi:hypothetical protein